MSDLIRVREAARLAAVSPAFLYREVRKGTLPAFRLQGSEVLLLRREDFTDWLESRLVRASGPIRPSRRHG